MTIMITTKKKGRLALCGDHPTDEVSTEARRPKVQMNYDET